MSQVAWIPADEEFIRKALGLAPGEEIPGEVVSNYVKVRHLYHGCFRNGPVDPVLLACMVVGLERLPGPKKVQSPMQGVPVGTWVVSRRGMSVIRGTFQGLKPAPLDSIAVVWAEDSPELEMAIADHLLEIVKEQRRPDVVPLKKKPVEQPAVNSADPLDDAVDSLPVASGVFSWDEVEPDSPVSVDVGDGSVVDGKFVRCTEDGRISVRLASGGKAKMFSEDCVRLVSSQELGDLLQFNAAKS